MPIFLVIFSSISLWLVSKEFAIITALWFFIWIFVVLFLGDELGKRGERYFSQISKNLGQLVDLLNNIFIVKISHSGELAEEIFQKKLRKAAKKSMDFQFWISISFWSYNIGAILLQMVNLYIIYIKINNGSFKPTDSIIVLTTNQIIFGWSWRFVLGLIRVIEATSQISEGLKILEQDPEEQEENNAPNLVLTRGDIEFDQVTLGYGDELLFKTSLS